MANGLKLFLYKLRSIPKNIQIFFFISSFSILLIELLLKRFPSPTLIFYTVGDIYLKLCYSIAAAIIFYFINQHLPRERKKLKSIILVNNKIFYIHREIEYLLLAVSNSFDKIEFADITKKMLEDECNKINPHTKVILPGEAATPFENWFEYFNYKSFKVKSIINDLLPLYDIIDPGVMADIYLIDDEISHRLHMDKKRISNPTLGYWANIIYHLVKDSDAASRNFRTKYRNVLKEHQIVSIKEKMGERYHGSANK